MSNPSTPLKIVNFGSVDDCKGNESGAPGKCTKFTKSPQVVFNNNVPDDQAGKHARSTPSSGRGKLKKLREQVKAKLAAQRLGRASPSHIVSKSMLTFDLHGGQIKDDEIPGESELFVKFVKDRRASSGRGSLKELINKRIAFQVGAQALAIRQAERGVKSSEQLKSDDGKENEKREKMRKKLSAKVRRRRSKKPEVENRKSESLEVPLAQEDAEELQVSQTQVLGHNEVMSQTQVYRDAEAESLQDTPLPFLGTPQVSFEARDDVISPTGRRSLLEPVSEEGESETRARRPLVRNPFIDDEAEESGDGSEDFSGSDSDADLSDLIASSPEQSQSQGDHARLHAQWLNQQEESFDPFLVKNRSTDKNCKNEARRIRRALFPINELPVPIKKPTKQKKTREPLKEPTVEPIAPKPAPKRKEVWVKKYPHRKSSVSSACSELDIRIGGNILNRNDRSSVTGGPFTFIKAPPRDKLERAIASVAVREEATAKAMAGATKLMGSKRFAFGQSTVTN